MGIFSSLFGIGDHDNAHTNHKSTEGGVRTVRVSYDDADKSSGKHETTWSKTDYSSGKHSEGWHGKDYDKSNSGNKN